MELVKIMKSEFMPIYDEMRKSFISDEIKDKNGALDTLNNPLFTVYHIVESNSKIGFMTVWNLGEFTFLEHFVIYEQHRNKNYGGHALKILQQMCGNLVLEAETPETPIAARRLNFYKRNGMYINESEYFQPAYTAAGHPCQMYLLSFPAELENFERTAAIIYNNVYGKTYPNYN